VNLSVIKGDLKIKHYKALPKSTIGCFTQQYEENPLQTTAILTYECWNFVTLHFSEKYNIFLSRNPGFYSKKQGKIKVLKFL